MGKIILVVEDEPAVQELIALSVITAGHQVIRASSAEEAAAELKSSLADLIVLDWMLPGASGIEFSRRLRSDKRLNTIPIIMLTARSDESDKVMALEIGVDDYITKPFSPRELNARINSVLRRCDTRDEDWNLLAAGLTLQTNARKLSASAKASVSLGPTEFRLMHHFMTNCERIVSRGQLLSSVWGNDKAVDERTIDVHIRRLRILLEQLGCEDRLQTVRGSGYRLSQLSES